MRKVIFSTFVLLLLCVLMVTVFVGCDGASDSKAYSIKMNDENWLYEKLPSSAKAGDKVTVKITRDKDVGMYVFMVNGEQLGEDANNFNKDYWQFSFTMPSEDVMIEFETHQHLPPILEIEHDFTVQYIRTDGYHDGVRYPVVTVIHSVDELNAYYEANKDNYSLGRRTGTIYSYSTIGFLDACDKYDEEYFENKSLVMVLLEEGSGSIRHKVERVMANDDGIVVDITTIVPEVFTDDMAEWHILIESELGAFAENEDDITVYIDGRDATEKIIEVYYEKGYANIALTLKEGWQYDIVDEPDTKEFAVNIYPEGQKDNKLRIAYFDFFGVCGTGLKQEEIKLGEYDAWMGTYDNNKVWDFISIKDTFGDYAIINEGGEKWWNEYGDEAMQILETIKVADGYVSESEAIQVAKDKADSADEDPDVEFDEEKAVWHITLSGKNTSGDDTFVIDVHGNIIEIIE